MGKFGNWISNNAMGLVGMVGGAIAAKRQFNNEKKLMGLQAQYNKEQAKYTSDLQKDMWDYTNYENQMQHIKNAGLNPALIYGMSGGGGSTTGTAQAAGVNNTGSQAVGMGLEAAQLLSNIRLNNAMADKNEADADKTRGVDTEFTKAQTKLAEFNATLADKKGKLTDEDIKNAKLYGDKLVEEIELLDTQGNIAKETMQNEIEKSAQELLNMQWEGFLKQMQGKLTAEEVKIAKEKIEMMWYGLITDRRNADAAKENAHTNARQLEELAKKWNKELDQADQRILQDYILGGADTVIRFVQAITDILPTKQAKQIIDTVFSEDSKGNWRSSRSTRTEKGSSRKGK